MHTPRLRQRFLTRSTHLAVIGLLGAGSIAHAQIGSDDFEAGNPNDWGVEFNHSGTQVATGGNPGGRLEISISNVSSNLPAAMIVPASPNHPYKGDFRALGAGGFRFDRQVESGSSNFGTRPYLVLGNDGGTNADYSDDAWIFVATGDNFQFGFSPWATISTPIPVTAFALPLGWDAYAFPGSPWSTHNVDDLWDSIIQDVSYVGIAMERPWNGASWFGTHVLSLDNFVLDNNGSVGISYCGPAALNSTGMSGEIKALGTELLSANNMILGASSLPSFSFGFFINSSTQGFVMNPGGSAGNLCLGGAIGRYVGSGEILNSGLAGQITLPIDLTRMPTPTGFVSLSVGQTWNFQTWYRDSSPAGSTSNFTNGVMIMVR